MLVDASLSATSKETSPSASTQMRTKLGAFSETCDRHGISDRSAAALASAVLQDVGIITPDNLSKVIDRSKVRRARQRNRSNLLKIDKPAAEHLQGLYFDGRKDQTMVQVKKGDKFYRQTTVEEHVALVQQPEGNYIGHIVPASGTAQNITTSIVQFLAKIGIDTDSLEAVGCDGTAVNTGAKGGVIRLLEKKLNRPLQWFVCMFHGNELTLRHLFKHLDGKTSGPRGFSGSIGKQLETCDDLPIIHFERLDGNLPEMTEDTVNDLSRDQKYLFEICQAVCSGECSDSLSRRNPGRIAHSRWITMANRILRLYVGVENPSPQLKTLAEYIVKVYTPMWFFIKCYSSCKNGAKHLWRTINFSRYLQKDLKDIVDAVIQRNGFFGHPENVLLAMIADERVKVRELGLRRILKARSEATSCRDIRIFKLPNFNFDAKDYIDMIPWQECTVTEPPILSGLCDDELKDYIRSNEIPKLEKYPCHTQSVERCVKLVTEASASVCGAEARDGFIRATVASRKCMPFFNTKADFVAKT